MENPNAGGFTLPGESGREKLTLELADRWGADMLRDSDGTKLSDELLNAGMGIYSTICLIREDNEWAKAHPDTLQQNFLMSDPVTATKDTVEIDLLSGFSRDQFQVNATDESVAYWQVFDRTTGEEIPKTHWCLVNTNHVVIEQAHPWHQYTVNFLATRLWEEISMYNHVTNDWGDRERLQAIDPRHPSAAQHILQWLDQWCTEHPQTSVVRFTSLFYNFAWFWGSDADLPHRYTDWGSYDFTVSPLALRQFTAETGKTITSEDFVNAGRYNSTHNPPTSIYKDWMDFIGKFVRNLGSKCVDIVHKYGKKAVVFYDDSWIGLEPQSETFKEFGFDGIIKALFSGYEARLCAGVNVPSHELRLHPYLFPVDLEGKPTFSPGGHPEKDLQRFWPNIRRAMLRAPIERIGLGGYPSLTEGYPEFVDEVAEVSRQHRLIRDLHANHSVLSEAITVGVLTAWGKLRTWSTSGHMHESPELALTHVLDALSGLPFDVQFLSFDDICAGGLDDIDVLINAGPAGSAWSGGGHWMNPDVIEAVRAWTACGGGFIGIDSPSAADHGLGMFQLSDVLGVDIDCGDKHCVAKRSFEIRNHPLLNDGAAPSTINKQGLFLSRANVDVVAAEGGLPTLTATDYENGRAVYMTQLRQNPGQVRLLENAILWVAKKERTLPWSKDPKVEVASFEGASHVLVVNNVQQEIHTEICVGTNTHPLTIPAGSLLQVDKESIK